MGGFWGAANVLDLSRVQFVKTLTLAVCALWGTRLILQFQVFYNADPEPNRVLSSS